MEIKNKTQTFINMTKKMIMNANDDGVAAVYALGRKQTKNYIIQTSIMEVIL